MKVGEVLRLGPLPRRQEVSDIQRPEVAQSRLDTWLSRHPVVVATVLWVALVAVYHIDDSLVEEGDAVANVELPLALLETGVLHFSPRYSPIVFFWQSQAPLREREDYYVRNWFEHHAGQPAGVWYATGNLRFNGPRYFAVKSPTREAYVSTFSALPGLSFLPMAALLRAIDHDFAYKTALRLSAAKLYAASLVALSAALLFLIALRFTPPSMALLVALAFALGTCAWSIASETLWQQTINIALVCGAVFTFLHALEAKERRWPICVAGLLLGTATASRPTAVLFFAAIAIYLWIHRRSAVPLLLAGAAPILLATAIYNLYYFGSPFNFAQELIGHRIALEKTGSDSVWQTPLIVGAVGLLMSPSRGLLVFSPFLALSFWGFLRLWKDPLYGPLRPLAVAALLTMAVQCKWFDWWGGWAYGYRPWLEAVPVLVLCLLPVIGLVCARRWSAFAFGVALGWSIFIQGLGAFAYDKYWNARDLHVVTEPSGPRRFFIRQGDAQREAKRGGGTYAGTFACNIDFPECRYRLWSIEDNVIRFYLQHYAEVRKARMRSAWHDLAIFE